MHVTIDGFHVPAEKLLDRDLLYKTLDNLPATIGMTKIAGPFVEPLQDGIGFCGIVIIAESHCSIHTSPHTGRVFADIFSCKEFAVSTAVKAFAEAMGVDWKALNVGILERGLEYDHPNLNTTIP